MIIKQADRIKVSDNFYLDEFIHPTIYKRYGAKSIWFLDYRLINGAQMLRELFAVPLTINNYASGGSRKNSGFRLPNSNVGAKYSQHKYGRAIDIKISRMTNYDEARKIIRDNFHLFHSAGFTTIEQGTQGWLHCDMRNTQLDKLYEVPFY